jgi:tripartite-type tricarboxylate transporter receptor subunit TctC
LYPKLPFDPIEDFEPITLIGREPGVVVVNLALPVKLQELIAYVKAHPARLTTRHRAMAAGSTCSPRCCARSPA